MPVSTRLHGLIDYAAALSLGSFAAGGLLGGRSREVAAIATVGPVVAFLSTDFEGGVVPIFSARQHARFDVAWGAGLFVTALALRDEPAESRALLAGYGLAQLLLGLTTERDAEEGPGDRSGPLARLLG